MNTGQTIMVTIAVPLLIAGLALLLVPVLRKGRSRSEGATYGLRIVGAMLFALGLFLGGFATAAALARVA